MANDNPIGIGYAHARPYAGHHQPARQTTLARRWESHWLAPATAASKLSADPPAALRRLHDLHFRRALDLLDASLRWEAILAGDYDSPLASDADFRHTLALAIARRKSRMGRVKGQVKGRGKDKSKRKEKHAD